MVKLTCKFPTIQNVNVSLIVLKHYLLEFNWRRAITQCTHPVNVLTTNLGIKIVRKRIPTRRSVAFLQLAWHSYSCGQTVGWIKMPLGKEVSLGPGHIVLDGDPVVTQHPTAASPHFRSMSIVAKRSPISTTAELLLHNQQCCYSLNSLSVTPSLSTLYIVHSCGFSAPPIQRLPQLLEISHTGRFQLGGGFWVAQRRWSWLGQLRTTWPESSVCYRVSDRIRWLLEVSRSTQQAYRIPQQHCSESVL